MDTSINSNMYAPMAVNTSVTMPAGYPPQQNGYPPQQHVYTAQSQQTQVMEVKSANTFESFSGENASSEYMKGQNSFKAERKTNCCNLFTCSFQQLHYYTNTFGVITVRRYDPGLCTYCCSPIKRCFCRYSLPPYAETQPGSRLNLLISKDLRGSLSINNVIIGEYSVQFSGTCWEYLFGRTPMVVIKKSGSTDKFEYRTSPNCIRQNIESICGCLVLRRSIELKKNNNPLQIQFNGTRTFCQGCGLCKHVFPSTDAEFNSTVTDQDKLLFIGAWIFMQELDNETFHCCM